MKDIKGFEGLYAVSEDGKVWAYPKQHGAFYKRGRFLVLREGRYVRVHLRNGPVSCMRSVHRLVALTYIPNPENKYAVNHKNGVRTDNRIENLEWCTNKENAFHAGVTGLMPHGENNNRSKLNDEKVKKIREEYKDINATCGSLAEKYKVSGVLISCIVRRKIWKHVK